MFLFFLYKVLTMTFQCLSFSVSYNFCLALDIFISQKAFERRQTRLWKNQIKKNHFFSKSSLENSLSEFWRENIHNGRQKKIFLKAGSQPKEWWTWIIVLVVLLNLQPWNFAKVLFMTFLIHVRYSFLLFVLKKEMTAILLLCIQWKEKAPVSLLFELFDIKIVFQISIGKT